MDKKLLKTEFAKDSKSMQITVEGEIIISDAQPDIKEIICENVKPAITFYSVSDGRISYKGALRASAIYVSKDSEEPVSAASTVINFEDIMNIDGIMKENCVRVSVCTDRYEFRKINERKVSVKAVLTIGVKIFVTSECSCITADENEDGMQYQVQSDIVRNHVSQDKTDFDIHETFSIPAVKPEAGEVLTEFYSVADVDTKAMRGGYRITGVLKVDMVYLTKDSASADSVHFEAPFEQTVDNDFVTEDMHAVSNVSVTGLKAGAFEDSGGENRIVDIDAVFNEVTDVFDDEKILLNIHAQLRRRK